MSKKRKKKKKQSLLKTLLITSIITLITIFIVIYVMDMFRIYEINSLVNSYESEFKKELESLPIKDNETIDSLKTKYNEIINNAIKLNQKDNENIFVEFHPELLRNREDLIFVMFNSKISFEKAYSLKPYISKTAIQVYKD